MPELRGVKLSVRQWQILNLLIAGKTTKEIAAALNLAEGTIYRYVETLVLKVGVRRRVEVVAWALGAGEDRPLAA